MMMCMRQMVQASKGFTLIEVLLTIVLLTSGLVALMQMLSISVYADGQVEMRDTALHLAKGKMEEIRNAASFASVDDFAATKTVMAGDFADFSQEVTVSGTDLKEVHVLMYWTSKGDEQSLDVASLFTDYGY